MKERDEHINELFFQREIGKCVLVMYNGCVLCIKYVGRNQRKRPFGQT